MRELFHVSNFPNVEPPSHVGDFALAFECYGLRHADEAGSLVGRELQCELSFVYQVLHFFHSSIGASQPFFANRLTLSVTA